VSPSADRRPGLGAPLLTLTGWLALALALARVALTTLSDLPLPGQAPAGVSQERMQDFRDATYYPIREFWRSGGMPYDPQAMFAHWPVIQEFDLYLPAHLWLHAPLALPGYRTAAALMLALDGLLVVLLTRWAVQWTGQWSAPARAAEAWAWPWLAAVVLFGQVGKAQLYLGQINPLVAVGTAGALGWRHRPALAAACLALAWLKPQYGLPLTLLLLATARRRVALFGTALAALASLPVLGVLVARAGGVEGFLDVVQRNLAFATSTGYGAVDSPTGLRIDLTALVARTLGWTPPAATEVVAAVLVLGLAIYVLRRAATTSPVGAPGMAPDALRSGLADLVAVLAVLIAVVHQPGDVLAAVPSAVVVGAAALRALLGEPARRDRASAWLAMASVAALAVPHLQVHVVHQLLIDTLGRRGAALLDAAAVVAALLGLAALILLTRSAEPSSSGSPG
jgi:hypothetical protein